VEAFLDQLEGIVIKPDGLTGGKGVLVQDDHFTTKEEALQLCLQILKESSSLIVEEKFDGEEFSLQCLCDGKTVIATPLVQDHKRRFEATKDPTPEVWALIPCPINSMPFLKPQDLEDGLEITRQSRRRS